MERTPLHTNSFFCVFRSGLHPNRLAGDCSGKRFLSKTADPVLTIYQDGEALATNEGWANFAEITTAATQAGAFALTADSRDAALLVTLKPGSYTAQVKATQVTSSGVALIEIYEVP